MVILKWPLDGYRRFLDWRELRVLRGEDVIVPKQEPQDAWNDRDRGREEKGDGSGAE